MGNFINRLVVVLAAFAAQSHSNISPGPPAIGPPGTVAHGNQPSHVPAGVTPPTGEVYWNGGSGQWEFIPRGGQRRGKWVFKTSTSAAGEWGFVGDPSAKHRESSSWRKQKSRRRHRRRSDDDQSTDDDDFSDEESYERKMKRLRRKNRKIAAERSGSHYRKGWRDGFLGSFSTNRNWGGSWEDGLGAWGQNTHAPWVSGIGGTNFRGGWEHAPYGQWEVGPFRHAFAHKVLPHTNDMNNGYPMVYYGHPQLQRPKYTPEDIWRLEREVQIVNDNRLLRARRSPPSFDEAVWVKVEKPVPSAPAKSRENSRNGVVIVQEQETQTE